MNKTSARSLTYRPDIDGLRSIAVVSVVLYHAGSRVFSGGYVGVDIFFVISGYLITSLIASELSKGSFSIRGFYDRRIRRIFPALAVVCLVTSVAAWFLLMPLDFKEFGESLFAMSVFGSNIYFDILNGYFDQAAELRPLLHTWSLSVEEQYYAFFPIILMVLYKFRRRVTPWVIFLLWAVSLTASIYEMRSNSTAAFYVIFFRAWELFTGSLIALQLVPRPAIKGVREALALAGLVLILVPIYFYTKDTSFPGLAALPPVIGAALVIYADEHGATSVSRLLGLRPFVFVGLVSYSFYLWHWPVFVFARYITMRELSPYEGFGLALVAFVLSVLSWRYVERPFRHVARDNKIHVFASAAICVALGVSFGFSARLLHGLPSRLPTDVARIAKVALDINPYRKACDSRSPDRLDHDDVCLIGKHDGPITFALIGDSFADAMAPGVDAEAVDAGQRGYSLTSAGCVPLVGTNQHKDGACRAFLDAAVRLIDRHPSVRTVILVGRWTSVSEGTRIGSIIMNDMFVSDDETRQPSYAENRSVLERGMKRNLDALASRRIFVAAFIPEQTVNVPRVMSLRRYFGILGDISIDRVSFDHRQQFVRDLFARLQRSYSFTILDVGGQLCDAKVCAASRDGIPLYIDDSHLSRGAGITIMKKFAPAFAGGGWPISQ